MEAFKVHFTNPFHHQSALLNDHFWPSLLASYTVTSQQFQISAAPPNEPSVTGLQGCSHTSVWLCTARGTASTTAVGQEDTAHELGSKITINKLQKQRLLIENKT